MLQSLALSEGACDMLTLARPQCLGVQSEQVRLTDFLKQSVVGFALLKLEVLKLLFLKKKFS